jgi:hypothetical protein
VVGVWREGSEVQEFSLHVMTEEGQ